MTGTSRRPGALKYRAGHHPSEDPAIRFRVDPDSPREPADGMEPSHAARRHYRPEIDGLRAVAVLPVVLGHAGIPGFAGGYIGVDIFFAISGFLITQILLRELDRGHFSALAFYERRARRILPPLFPVMAFALVAGAFLMSADAFENLGQSVVATTLFANNLLLVLTTGYWDTESAFKPLLHTWSLGVEEQYYLLVPWLLIAVHRGARAHVAGVLALIGAASFVACQLDGSEAAFYLLHTRVWELATSACAAALLHGRERDPASGALAAGGLVLVLAALFAFPAALPLPSAPAVMAVAGSTLILAFGNAGRAARMLSWRPLVATGVISYGLYLWHQPLFVYLRIASIEEPPAWQFAAMLVPCFVLAWASWRWVETPMRDRRRTSRRVLVRCLAPASLAMLGAGLLLHAGGGWPQRLPMPPGSEPAGAYVAYNMSAFEHRKDAFAASAGKRLLVVGDSTARDFVNMAKETGFFAGYELVYREDLVPCELEYAGATHRSLVQAATLIVVAGSHECDNRRLLAARPALRGRIVFVGDRDFGTNLNPLARLPLSQRSGARVRVSPAALASNARLRAATPPELFIDVIGRLSDDGVTVPVFDEAGRLLSEDRTHLTRSGARFVGARVFADPAWARVAARLPLHH